MTWPVLVVALALWMLAPMAVAGDQPSTGTAAEKEMRAEPLQALPSSQPTMSGASELTRERERPMIMPETASDQKQPELTPEILEQLNVQDERSALSC